MSIIVNISDEIEFNDFINKNERNLIIAHFGADWAPQCKQINDMLSEINNQSTNTSFVYVEAEKVPQLSLQYKITGVPTILFFKRKQVIQTIKGGNPRDLLNALKQMHVGTSSETKKDSIEDQLKKLINKDIVMLFMKGAPESPQCGFSRKIVQLLSDCDAKYQSFDILTNNDIREGLKKFSNWPTYPQLYIQGELVGGVDIVQEMVQNGELVKMINDANASTKEKLDNRLRSLVNKSRVVLFMKGSPDSPKCGFSRNTVQILKSAKIEFSHFDILSDDEVRQGLKIFSNWPTYPQLYVNGDLLGGFDIIKEMNESGELVSACNQ